MEQNRNTYPMQTLKISDGVTTIDLLSLTTGFYPMEWIPSAADVKSGGAWGDNAIADGRVPIVRALQNTTETFTLAARSWTQDLLIRDMNALRSLLLQGSLYWTRASEARPVWIQARGWNETGDRYTVVVDYRMPQSIDPYGEGFTGSASMPGDAALELYIEHEPFWTDAPPSDPECLPLYNYHDGCTLYPARFEGTTGTGIITIAPHALINDLHVASFQVEFWIYVNALHTGIDGRIADKRQASVNGWRLALLAGGALNMSVSAGGAWGWAQVAAGGLPLQEWTHVVVTYDDLTDRLPHFAINGTWVAAPGAACVGAALSDVANNLTFGNLNALTQPLDADLGPMRIVPKLTYTVGQDFPVPSRCVMLPYDAGLAWLGIYEGQGTSVANLASPGAATGTMAPANWGDCCPRPLGNVARSVYGIQASADDAYVDHVAVSISTAGNTLFFGDQAGASFETGLRFSGVFADIPPNRTVRIIDARLSFRGMGAGPAGTQIMYVSAENNRSPAAFSTYADFSGRPRLTQSAAWTIYGPFTLGEVYWSENIAAVVQEAIDQPGWDPGGAIALFIGNAIIGTAHAIASVDNVTYTRPYLDVTYTLDGESALPTCEEQRVFTTNHWQRAQISHMFLASGPFFSPNMIGSIMPQPLLGPAVAPGWMLYLGIDTTILDSGPFSSIVFNIGIAGADYTAVWEIWTGAAWVALAVQDGTNAGGAMTGIPLDTLGVGSVHWEIPSTWATTAVNGITGYWVRLRVTAAGGAPVNPYQADTDPYTLTEPWIACSAHDVPGTMSALTRLMCRAQSDRDNNSTPPGLVTDTLYAGLRLGDDPLFCAYLNCADEQTPEGVTCSDMGGGAFATDPRTPAGRWYNCGVPAAAWAHMVRFSFTQEVTRSYVGEYRAFVRGAYSGGGQPQFLLVVNMPDETGRYGPALLDSQAGALDGLADLGRVVIPGRSYMTVDDSRIGMFLDLYIYGDGVSTVYMTDLILLPADVLFLSTERISIGGRSVLSDAGILPFEVKSGVLDLDSVIMPKNRRRALGRRYYNDRIYATGPWGGTSPLWVDNVQTSKLWVLHAVTGYAGSVRIGVAEHEASYSYTAQRLARYEDMRGAE